jgi:hypothetical protein
MLSHHRRRVRAFARPVHYQNEQPPGQKDEAAHRGVHAVTVDALKPIVSSGRGGKHWAGRLHSQNA